ncbi:uncharacterized protein LOC122373841 isoform X2 [Amphibalanus amphitrite]|uniref:uncharacterized protein LOC122373841 isoform X2 n=1 Tax=Amphibalanus amphitrite TaxID=1232801 RepID=UPI001C90BA26|nr:uncharacterized protein LOC122373841 isoform X2 [Amphibalanus amphitrite]
MKQIFALCSCMAMVVALVSTSETSEAESKEERLIGAIITSTTTLSRLRTTTVTAPLTCLLGVPPAATACTGRRRRRHATGATMYPHDMPASANQAVDKLDSSMVSSSDERKGKILLFATRLVTSLTDFTTTSTSTDSSTTVSVSVLCTVAGIPIAESFRICAA